MAYPYPTTAAFPGAPGFQPGPLGEGIAYFTPNLEQVVGSGPTTYGYLPQQSNPALAGSPTPICGQISLDANVQYTVNAINAGMVVPYGDFGGPNVYWFQTFENAIGNIVYTVFDRESTLGLASFMVRFGAASTIRQVLFQPMPRSEIALQFLVLPRVPYQVCGNGQVTP